MPTVDRATNVTVLATDPSMKRLMPKSNMIRLLSADDLEEAETAPNIFIVTTTSKLDTVAKFAQIAHKHRGLRALLIPQNERQVWLPQMFRKRFPRAQHITLYSDDAVPRRIIEAWAAGAASVLIADAWVIQNELVVQSCALELLRVPFSLVPLNSLKLEQRDQFRIDRDGTSICWPRSALELDLDGVRLLVDPALQQDKYRERMQHDQCFGRAVATLRYKARLRQRDIEGLSERHVRRIEDGARISSDAIKHLAKSHDLSPDAYMEQIAEFMVAERNRDHKARRVRTA